MAEHLHNFALSGQQGLETHVAAVDPTTMRVNRERENAKQ